MINPTVNASRSIPEACEHSRILEAQGRHSEAEVLFAPHWFGVGHLPVVESLPLPEQAALLLRAAALTTNLGAVNKLPGAQESAKQLLLRANYLFRTLADGDGQAEALSELAYVERRLGNINRGRELVEQAVPLVSENNRELMAAVQLRRAIIEMAAGNQVEALSIFHEHAFLFDAPLDDGPTKDIRKLALAGMYFNMRGILYRGLALQERSWDYFDAGCADITAAQFFFHSAGHKRYEAAALNNLALFAIVHRDFDRAHGYVDRARHLLALPVDLVFIAQVEETRARIFGAERRFDDAERTIEQAVAILQEARDETAYLRDMLVIRDTIFAARENPEQAEQILRQVRPQFRLISGGKETPPPRRESITFRVEKDNHSLEFIGYRPGDVVPFEQAFRAHEGQFALVCVVPGNDLYAGFYHPNVDGTVIIDTNHPDYDPLILPSWRVQVRGVHRTVQRILER